MGLYIMSSFNNEDKLKFDNILSIYHKHASGGTFENSAALHVTVKYAYEDDSNNDLALAIMQEFEKLKFKKFKVLVNSFHRFETNKVDWLGMDNSFPLYQMKNELEKIAVSKGSQFKKDDFEGYTPHITIGFDNVVDDSLLKTFEPIEVTIDNIGLYGYSHKIGNAHVADILYNIQLGV